MKTILGLSCECFSIFELHPESQSIRQSTRRKYITFISELLLNSKPKLNPIDYKNMIILHN
jgi:hypothetical protein